MKKRASSTTMAIDPTNLSSDHLMHVSRTNSLSLELHLGFHYWCGLVNCHLPLYLLVYLGMPSVLQPVPSPGLDPAHSPLKLGSIQKFCSKVCDKAATTLWVSSYSLVWVHYPIRTETRVSLPISFPASLKQQIRQKDSYCVVCNVWSES